MFHRSQSDVWYAIRENGHCLETFDLAVYIRNHFQINIPSKQSRK